MKKEEFEIKKQREESFITEFIALCRKHNLGLDSEDPDCALSIVPLSYVEDYYNDPGSFGRCYYENIEKQIED